ncbi:MAG: ABC transporter ATP-binding protein [Spirochaetota bacterium]|jgi:putative ABC transport system ATP-binding protein|nr:ABC transporter ATP-binding protein [Spirochaetota bacterium]
MIDVNTISKRFYVAGQPFMALDAVSFSVERGDFICVSGSSGSGKTTLLNILAGILSPSSGEVLFEGKNIHTMSDRALSRFRGEELGFVYQSFNLVPRLTIAENVHAPLYFGKRPPGNARTLIDSVLELVGIAEKANEYPHHLSGGQIQRAAIARALIKSPALLLADEPTGNLDAKTGQEIIDLFKKLNAEGTTILTVSHDQRFYEAAERTLFLSFGKLERTSQRSGIKKPASARAKIPEAARKKAAAKKGGKR